MTSRTGRRGVAEAGSAPGHSSSVLVLGGTAEARALAADLVDAGRRVITSLAGRVRDPALPVGEVRIGGFSTAGGHGVAGLDGVAGLAGYLSTERIGAVVDATHPFAATISANAAAACVRTGTPLVRLERPGWRHHPDAERWVWVDAIEQAVTAGSASRRPFLTTGRQSVEVFRAWSDKDVLLRVVDPPARAVPSRWRVIRSRGPYGYPDEYALMSAASTDLLVTKDSGGSLTAAKLDAARDLGIQVLIVARPPAADIPRVDTVAAALTWLDGLEPAAGG